MSVISGSVAISVDFIQTLGVPYSVAVDVAEAINASLANGAGSDQIDGAAKFTVSPALSATIEIDLQAMTDVNGVAVSFQEIRGFLILGASGNDNAVHMEQGAANKWTTGFLQGTAPEVPVEASGALLGLAVKAAQWTVTGASKTIGFANQSSAQQNTVSGIFFGRLS